LQVGIEVRIHCHPFHAPIELELTALSQTESRQQIGLQAPGVASTRLA
jgi:hypothetical protein